LLALPTAPFSHSAEERPTAGGRLMWDSSEELDLIADIWADLPHVLENGDSLFLSMQLRTAIEKAESDFTFSLRDVVAELELGWRRPLGLFGGSRLSLFAGERSKLLVDSEGDAYIAYLGAALESSDFRAYPPPDERPRSAWRLALGPVLEHGGVEADFMFAGQGRFRPWPRSSRFASSIELALELDGLLVDGNFDADISGGPAFALALPSGNLMRFFVHYQHGDHLLGVGHSAILVGYEYSGAAGNGSLPPSPPEISGMLAGGVGADDREAARFRLGVRTPQLVRDWRLAFVVDANLLTARDTNELYYFYHLGMERPLQKNIAGIYFYHRSNHQLDTANDRITSINVIEAGIETDGWHDAGDRSPLRRWGRIDARARLGYLLDSTFGEDQRWHVRGGLRWRMPMTAGRVRPFVAVEAEAGDVERQSYALGTSLGEALSAQLEYRDDEQYFGSDRTALLLLLVYAF
jgi:hypothetical protein